MAMKTDDKASISITKAKSINVGLKETEGDKACTRLIRKEYYELVQFLWSSKVHTCKYGHGRDTSKIRADNKSIHTFQTDLPLHISKLVLYALVQLIWCSYFI